MVEVSISGVCIAIFLALAAQGCCPCIDSPPPCPKCKEESLNLVSSIDALTERVKELGAVIEKKEIKFEFPGEFICKVESESKPIELRGTIGR